MRIGILRETAEEERRVALTPDGVKELVAKGHTVAIEPGAGTSAYFKDADYESAGATLGLDLSAIDLLLKVLPPSVDEVKQLQSGASLVSFLNATQNPDLIGALNSRNISSFAMELMPRISRAQSMDALSSMSTIAGYKAALLCAEHLPKFFPMFMTAAGTLPPARAFIIGAGVAGLQAIATCKRLGAIVEAFDVRPAVKEQIESLGGKFVGLSLLTDEAEDTGGYAKEVSTDTHQRELELIASRLKNVDCVITTALIPGKRAPILITNEMVQSMKPGSVIVDLAATAGGNCEATIPGKTVTVSEITIVGRTDLIGTMALDASKMYSKNVTAFLEVLTIDGALLLDRDDEIVRGTLVTHEGQVVHEVTRLALGGHA